MTGDEFRNWRRAMGMSQEAAAGALGLSRRMIQHYEAGRRYHDRIVDIPKTVELACRALEYEEHQKNARPEPD